MLTFCPQQPQPALSVVILTSKGKLICTPCHTSVKEVWTQYVIFRTLYCWLFYVEPCCAEVIQTIRCMSHRPQTSSKHIPLPPIGTSLSDRSLLGPYHSGGKDAYLGTQQKEIPSHPFCREKTFIFKIQERSHVPELGMELRNITLIKFQSTRI